MSKSVSSFSEKFVLQVNIKNTYKTNQLSELRIYDLDWEPVQDAFLTTNATYLGSGQEKKITALVPFGGRTKRTVYLCHSILPRVNGRGAKYRGEVCGKYTANKLEQ